MEVSVKKPGTPAEVLEHHGTKGMKWGVHKSREQRNKAIRTARYKKHTGKTVSLDDQAVAKRFTTGEKTVLSLLAVTGFATIPIAAYAGYRVASRKSIELRARKN